MCTKAPNAPDPPPPPPPPPRFVDPGVVAAKVDARSRLQQGGFAGTISGSSAGVTSDVNLISSNLLGA